MAKARLLQNSFIDGTLVDAGTIIEVDEKVIKASPHMELIPEPKKAEPKAPEPKK